MIEMVEIVILLLRNVKMFSHRFFGILSTNQYGDYPNDGCFSS